MKVILRIYSSEGTKREKHDVSYFRIERPRKYVKKDGIPVMAIPVPYAYLILYTESGDMFMYKYTQFVDISVRRGKSFVPCEEGYTFHEDDVCKITLVGEKIEYV